MRLKELKISLRSVSFREAFLIAILLHLILLLAIKVNPVVIFPADTKANIAAQKEQEPIKFTFVDVPQDKASPVRPETDRYSDKNRLAGGKSPEVNPEDKSRLPYSIGDTKEYTLATPPPEIPKEAIEGSEGSEDKSPAEQEKTLLESEPLSGDKLLVEPKKKTKPNIGETSSARKQDSLRKSLMNLDKYIDSGTFDNRESGLSTDGFLSFDTKDFDFGPYANLLYRIVKSNWIVPYAATHLGLKGVTVISFRIQKDGRITNLSIDNSSDIRPFDAAALNAIELSNPLPPLPKQFPDNSVGVRFGFFYNVVPPDK
jgi:TonB family protein